MDPVQSSHRRGFTLIEVMLATMLSLGIILLAYYAFQQAMLTLGTMQRLATENSMLRSGYLAVVDDADHWNSQANPEYPFLKGFMGNEGRLFQAVSFPKSIDDPLNPNWQQANDRRSWYRNHLAHNQQPPTWGESDYASRPAIGEVGRGWAPWHVYGDYSLTSHLGMSGAADSDQQAGARPVLMWSLSRQLGMTGLTGYMMPGTVNIIQRPNTNQTVAAIGDKTLRHDRGEVPWSLGLPPAGGAIPESERTNGHYAKAMPGYPYDFSFNPNQDIARNSFAADLLICSADRNVPLAVVYGSRPRGRNIAGTGTTEADFDFSGISTRWPWTLLDRGLDSQSFTAARRRFINTTWHVPSNFTDAPAPDLVLGRPAGVPAMNTSIFRYQIKGDDKALCHVALVDDRGRMTQLTFAITSTTYRGARQHWGLLTQGPEAPVGTRPIGDSYR